MKIFRSQQLVTVAILFAGSLVASNIVFDHISKGVPYKGTAERCSNINQLFNPSEPRCYEATYTFQDFGWPFTAIRRADAGNVNAEFRVHSIALDRSQTSYLSLNTVVLFGGAVACYFLLSRYVWKRFSYTHPFDSPIIQSSDMLDEAGLTSITKGQMAGYHYNLLTNSRGRLMLSVTLRNNTGIHVVAVGSKSVSSLPFSERLESRFLQPVRLEGDFPEHFHLYCTPGKELELLQIFDPATMARLIDFCKTHQFEIYNDTLYISQAADAEDELDETTMVADAETLLTKSGDTFDRLKA